MRRRITRSIAAALVALGMIATPAVANATPPGTAHQEEVLAGTASMSIDCDSIDTDAD